MRILDDFKREMEEGSAIGEIFHRKFIHTLYTHRYEIHSLKKYWKKGKVLNVGAGRDCGKIAENVESADIRKGKDEYTDSRGWKEDFKPDYIFDANKAFPFNDNEFDCVMSMHLLEHVDNPTFTMNEMLRVSNSIVCGIIPDADAIPPYVYWSDQTHKRAWTRDTFDNFLANLYCTFEQYCKMKKILNPYSFDFSVRKCY